MDGVLYRQLHQFHHGGERPVSRFADHRQSQGAADYLPDQGESHGLAEVLRHDRVQRTLGGIYKEYQGHGRACSLSPVRVQQRSQQGAGGLLQPARS